MQESRTTNSIKNFGTGFLMQLLNKIISFVCRTVFIVILNTEYLGINGLFTNVLSILSFAELGIGTAIVFSMYKPIADDNKEKIKGLLQLYKKAYNTIGTVIFIMGIMLIPFLKHLIKDTSNIKINISLLYVLFLINTTISYFFAYKKSIITAYQKERIISRINSLYYLTCNILQIIFLYLTHNYIVYLLIQIMITFSENLYISKKANKLYPYITEKNIQKIDRKEQKTIFSNVKDLTVYKFGSVILSSTDNIIISALINVKSVGLCSNYILIIESVRSLFNSAFNSITASIGNLNVKATSEKKEDILLQYNFICFWIYSFCAISFIVLLNPFIKLWLGEKFILPNIVAISLATSFWVVGIRGPAYTYRVTTGMFSKGKLAPYICSFFNILLSIVLGKIYGLPGIFFATSISQLLSYSWIDPYLIYKYQLKLPIKKYIYKHITYVVVFVFTCIITMLLANLINTNTLLDLLKKGTIVVTVTNLIFYIFMSRTYEYKEIKNKLLFNFIKKRKIKEVE